MFFATIQTSDDASGGSAPINKRHAVIVLACLWFMVCAVPVIACSGVTAATAKAFRCEPVSGAPFFFGKHPRHSSFSGLVKSPKPLINSLHAPSSGRFNLRDLSARRGVVLYAYRTHTDSALTSIPSGAISFCQEHSGLPVTRFCLLKSEVLKNALTMRYRIYMRYGILCQFENELFCK